MKGNLPVHGPKISVVLIAYDRPSMVEHALKTLTGQTYQDLEIVVVLNGATPEVRTTVAEFQTRSNNVSEVNFPVNIYNLDDFSLQIRTVYRAGFESTTGEFVFFQSDDDYVAQDFFSRMARLFIENGRCHSAIGLPCSHYWSDDRILPAEEGAWSKRSTYMPGTTVALRSLDSRTYPGFMPNPGFSYVMSRDGILKAEDFWGGFEMTQLTQVVAFGESGFDPLAAMYWGRGTHQGNVMVDTLPIRRSAALKRMYVSENQKERAVAYAMWQAAFSRAESGELSRLMKAREEEQTVQVFVRSLSAGHVSDAWKAVRLVGIPSMSFVSMLSLQMLRSIARLLTPRSVRERIRASSRGTS